MIKLIFLFLFFTQIPILSYAVECGSYAKTCSNPGAETVVFVDLNSKPNVPNKEINCARKAACEGKQDIIVFPGSDLSVTPANIAAKYKEFIKKLDQQNVNMSKMILSGHDGGSNYGGERGALSFNQIDDAFMDGEEPLAIKSKVKSLYGWGCYTATINEVDKKWLKSFPNLDYMLGYDLKAPLSDKTAGYEFLYEAMAAESKINSAKTVKDFSNSLKSLEWANSLNLAAFHKTCENKEDPNEADSSGADGFYLSTTYGDLTLKEAKEKCKTLRLEVESELTTYNQYLYGDLKIPAHGTDSPLRAFYNKLRATESCAVKGGTDLQITEDALPKPDDVIMLIYDDYLMSNFFSLYANDLEELKAVLKKAYPDKDMSLLIPKKEDLKDPLYRKKFAENIFQLNKEMAGIEKSDGEMDKRKKIGVFYETATADQKKSVQAVNNLNDMLFDLRVPIAWRDDPHSTVKTQPLIPDDTNSRRSVPGKTPGAGNVRPPGQ